MSSERGERTSEEHGRLEDRVLHALEGLPGRVAFNGLRRILGTHPESLARALRRLEREGLVEHADGGYRVLAENHRSIEELTAELHPIAWIDLPMGAGSESLFGRLAGRWFGSLRWVGLVERPDGRLLAWARRDRSGYVLLGVDRGRLRVFVPGPNGRDDSSEAEEAAYELLGHVTEALRPVSGPGGVVTFLLVGGPAPGFRDADN